MADILEMLDSKIKEHASLDRAFLLMEYGDWNRAEELLENVLSEEPRNSIAYLGKVMIKEKASSVESLAEISDETKSTPDYQIMLRFADDSVKAVLNAIEEKKREREKEEETRKQETLKEADGLSLSTKEEELKKAVSLYKSLDGWSDSEEKAQKAEKRLQDLETVYVKMIDRFNASATDEDYLEVVKYLQPVGEYKHAKQIAAEAEKRAKTYKEQQNIKRADMLLQRGDLASLKEAERIYASIEGQEGKLTECRKRIEAYCTLQYSEALRLMEEGTEYSYTRAIQALNGISDWRDSRDLIKRCEQSIEGLKEKEREEQERRERELAEKEEAKESLESEGEYTTQKVDTVVEGIEEDKKEEKRTVKGKKKSSKTKVVLLMIGLLLIIGGGLIYCFVTPLHTYIEAGFFARRGEYEKAISLYEDVEDYWNSGIKLIESKYNWAIKLYEENEYSEAIELLGQVGDYKDAKVLKDEYVIDEIVNSVENKGFYECIDALDKLEGDTGKTEEARYKILTELVKRVNNCTVSQKEAMGRYLYNNDDNASVRTVVKENTGVCLTYLSYYDWRYSEAALYYLGDSIVSLPVYRDLQYMAKWYGLWENTDGTKRFRIYGGEKVGDGDERLLYAANFTIRPCEISKKGLIDTIRVSENDYHQSADMRFIDGAVDFQSYGGIFASWNGQYHRASTSVPITVEYIEEKIRGW